MNSFRHVYRASSVGVAAIAGLALASGCCTKSYKTASYHQTSGAYAETTTTAQPEPAPAPTGRTEVAAGAGTNMVVPLYEEKINVGKREVDSGSVRLKKIVKTETVNQPIELRHEELIIERQSGSSATAGSKLLDQPFQEGETVVTVKSEVPVVEKQITTSGQVVLQTRATTTQTNIQGEVRREDIAIDRQGSTEGTGASESPSGKGAGASAQAGVQVGVITDPAMLSTSGDPSKWNGKDVQFSGVKVKRVIGDKIIVLDGGGNKQIYCYNKEASAALNTGDIVNVSGKIKTSADSSLGQAAQELASAPYYIDADKVEVSNK